MKNLDWPLYQDKNVAITCSADAIIPVWAYMLVTSYLQTVAKNIFTGSNEEMEKYLLLQNISSINAEEFNEQRIVVKGCGDIAIGSFAYAEITRKLLPHVKSIMYGELKHGRFIRRIIRLNLHDGFFGSRSRASNLFFIIYHYTYSIRKILSNE